MRSLNSFIYLNPPVALGPRVYSASNRNVYQKQNKFNKMFLGSRVWPTNEGDDESLKLNFR
jgi:hypothetical protein